MKSRFAFNLEAKTVLEKWLYIIPVMLIWGLIYACSLTFVYIEGDDATTVAYHAMGRNALLQPPYSPYHGMMDVFLSFFPADELVVRHAEMTISAISAVLFFILLVRLITDLLPKKVEGLNLVWVSVFVLLVSPEMFYFGLLYTPSITAMCFVLAAHLLVRRYRNGIASTFSGSRLSALLFSVILFGIGVSCRWDIGVYLIVIVTDLLLGVDYGAAELPTARQSLKENFVFAILWAAASSVAVIAVIYCTGYGISEIFTSLIWANREAADVKSWFSLIGAFQTLFTPAFIIFFAVGFYFFVRQSGRLAVLTLVGMLPVLPYLFSREPKMLLPALPGLFLAVFAGVNRIWFESRGVKYLRLRKAASLCALAIPWLVGVQVFSGETLWGPGFEIREAENSGVTKDAVEVVSSRVAERNVAIKNLQLRLAGGFAVPTAEGSRPFGGHAFVLFGGEWRKLMEKLDDERQQVVDRAIAEKLTVVQDGGNSLLIAKLLENKFQTLDPKSAHESDDINQRTFFNQNGDTIKVQILRRTNSFFEPETVSELLNFNPGGQVILFTGNSSTFVRLNKNAPESFEPTGAFSARLNLNKLVADYAKKQ